MLAEAEAKYGNVLKLLKEVSALVKEKLEAVITDIQYMRRKGDNALFMKAKVNGEQQTFMMLNSWEEKALQNKTMPELVFWNKIKDRFPNLEFNKGKKI